MKTAIVIPPARSEETRTRRTWKTHSRNLGKCVSTVNVINRHNMLHGYIKVGNSLFGFGKKCSFESRKDLVCEKIRYSWLGIVYEDFFHEGDASIYRTLVLNQFSRQDAMIVEYIGEKVRQTIADIREEQYEQEGVGSCYLFRLDKEYIVDATRAGGMAR